MQVDPGAPVDRPAPDALEELARTWEEAGTAPEAILAWVGERFGRDAVLACSFQAEDCVLVDMIARVAPRVGVFYLDTGLLFDETYATRDRLQERYGIRPVAFRPALTVAEQAAQYGEALWSRDPDLCCHMRKVLPLEQALAGRLCWITGIRRDQAPTRRHTPLIQWDARFRLVKVNPLARWTVDDVWNYIRAHDVPYNPMHDRGFPSIGCWPCTRAVRPGEDPRAGRWSGTGKIECGIHVAAPGAGDPPGVEA
jgi:phosphoadenosine phosphosulfate reductase